jgi:Divergent InlB B-repeat domain
LPTNGHRGRLPKRRRAACRRVSCPPASRCLVSSENPTLCVRLSPVASGQNPAAWVNAGVSDWQAQSSKEIRCRFASAEGGADPHASIRVSPRGHSFAHCDHENGRIRDHGEVGKSGWCRLESHYGTHRPAHHPLRRRVVRPHGLGMAGHGADYLPLHAQPTGGLYRWGRHSDANPLDGNFSATRNFDNGVSVHFNAGGEWWDLDFAAPQETLLTSGSYENATRFPFQSPTAPGLNVSGSGSGCNMLTGRFDVFEVVYGSGDTITSFAANFEQHCEGMAPALFGSIRFNAATMAPHSVSVTLQGSGSGTVTSVPAGINCGTDCDEPFTNGTVVALIAGPSAGSSFAGWSGDADCSDGVVSKAMPAACTASFAPSLSPPRRPPA